MDGVSHRPSNVPVIFAYSLAAGLIADAILVFGVKGIDRVVPIGKTMDFDLIWDGYDLVEQMSRIVVTV